MGSVFNLPVEWNDEDSRGIIYDIVIFTSFQNIALKFLKQGLNANTRRININPIFQIEILMK